MQFDSLQQILWCFLLCITTPKAESESGKAEIVLKFPKYPNVAYKSYPLQGLCYGIPGTGGEVYFRLSGKSLFDFLGTYCLRRNVIQEWRPMKSMAVKEVPAQYFRKKNLPGRKGLAFAFCVPKDMEDPLHLVCVTRNSSREQTSKVVKQIYTQYSPQLPLIIAHYHLPSRLLINGETLKLYCAGFVGTDGGMVFEIPKRGQKKKMMWTIYYDTSRSPAIESCRGCPKATITVNRRETSKGPRIDATLLLRVDDTLDQRVYYCFTTNFNGPGYKQRGRSAEESTVIEIPYKPMLRMDSFITSNSRNDPETSWIIEGFCNTSLQQTQKMSIVFRTSKFTYIYNYEDGNARTLWYTESISASNNVYLAGFNRELESNMLSIKIFASLVINSQPVTMSCKVQNLMVCQNLKPPVYKDNNIFNLTDKIVYLKLVPKGVVVVLLLVMIVMINYKLLSEKQLMNR